MSNRGEFMSQDNRPIVTTEEAITLLGVRVCEFNIYPLSRAVEGSGISWSVQALLA
jgi:hypothetical protein